MSKSDPMAVVMILKDGNWLEVTVNASYYLIFLWNLLSLSLNLFSGRRFP